MNAQAWTVLGMVVVATLSLVGGRMVAKIQAKSSPYQALADRTTALEASDVTKSEKIAALEADLRLKTQRIELLEGDFDILVPELVTWDAWVKAGAPPPPPMISDAAQKVIAHHRRRRTRLILADHNGDYVEDDR